MDRLLQGSLCVNPLSDWSIPPDTGQHDEPWTSLQLAESTLIFSSYDATNLNF